LENDLDANYELGKDIDCSETVSWNGGEGFDPIGQSSPFFSGTFNGKFNVIEGLFINRSSENYVGLFGRTNIDFIINNTNLVNANISGNVITGGFVASNYGSLLNSFFEGFILGISASGGVVGLNHGMVEKCLSEGYINGTNDVGGLVGQNAGGIVKPNDFCPDILYLVSHRLCILKLISIFPCKHDIFPCFNSRPTLGIPEKTSTRIARAHFKINQPDFPAWNVDENVVITQIIVTNSRSP